MPLDPPAPPADIFLLLTLLLLVVLVEKGRPHELLREATPREPAPPALPVAPVAAAVGVLQGGGGGGVVLVLLLLSLPGLLLLEMSLSIKTPTWGDLGVCKGEKREVLTGFRV